MIPISFCTVKRMFSAMLILRWVNSLSSTLCLPLNSDLLVHSSHSPYWTKINSKIEATTFLFLSLNWLGSILVNKKRISTNISKSFFFFWKVRIVEIIFLHPLFNMFLYSTTVCKIFFCSLNKRTMAIHIWISLNQIKVLKINIFLSFVLIHIFMSSGTGFFMLLHLLLVFNVMVQYFFHVSRAENRKRQKNSSMPNRYFNVTNIIVAWKIAPRFVTLLICF